MKKDMKNNMAKKPENIMDNSKVFKVILFFLVLLYVIMGLILFASLFVSMSSVKSIVTNSTFWSSLFSLVINENSTLLYISAISINVTLTFIFFILKETKKFPTKITIISLGVTSATCLSVKTISYIIFSLNIFLDFQLLYIFPLITIILSNVFLSYDFIDYCRGTYKPVRSKVNLPTRELVKETFEIISNRNKFIPNNTYKEKAINKNNDQNDSNNSNYKKNEYKTEHGYFNNEALEMAASHIVSTIDRATQQKVEQHNVID
ncbi:MAG: hypothetical protein EOM05_06730 [Clostridia bacterium]|nr:hypothetical protein [Clostridia bacterium]